MAKKVIRLTEEEFKNIVIESTAQVINEIGYRVASLPHGANYNAMQSKIQQGDKNANNKIDASNNIRISTLTKAIEDNFPNLVLYFIERDKANQYYTVVFNFKEMSTINDERFVMKGDIAISGGKTKQGYVEFNFNQQSFYRVNFYGQGTIRRIYQLMMDNDHKDIFLKFLTFITNFCYSEKDYEHNINVNKPTLSKKH